MYYGQHAQLACLPLITVDDPIARSRRVQNSKAPDIAMSPHSFPRLDVDVCRPELVIAIGGEFVDCAGIGFDLIERLKHSGRCVRIFNPQPTDIVESVLMDIYGANYTQLGIRYASRCAKLLSL